MQDSLLRPLPFFLVLIVSCVSLAVAGPAQVASAATQNCGAEDHRFDGAYFFDTAHPARGASANIEVRSPALCGNSNIYDSFSSAWTGLEPADGHGIIQVGWSKDTYNENNQVLTQHWFAWTANIASYYNLVRYGNPVWGSVHEYKVTYDWNDQKAHMYVDHLAPACKNGICPVTNFNPVTTWESPGNPIWALYKGEVDHKGNDMPGINNNHEPFTAVNVRWTNQTWYVVLNNGGVLYSDYTCAFKISNDYPAFSIYTEPLDHGGC